MYINHERINATLLFIISFSLTALGIYLNKYDPLTAAQMVPHTFTLNVLFINITFFGSGIFCFCLISYLFYKKNYAIAFLIACSTLLAAIIIQILKNYLHNDGIQLFFEDEQYLFNQISAKATSPSAHTALVFSLATVLSLKFQNRWSSIICFITAGIVAYSRIYLGYHTIPDLFAGVFIGVASGSISYYYYLNPIKFHSIRFLSHQKFNNPEIQ